MKKKRWIFEFPFSYTKDADTACVNTHLKTNTMKKIIYSLFSSLVTTKNFAVSFLNGLVEIRTNELKRSGLDK